MTVTEWAIGIVFILVLGVFVWLLLAPRLERTTEPRRTLVRVIKVAGGHPQDERRPAMYRHVVQLQGGEEANMTSQRVFSAGTLLRATVSRGRTSGRLAVEGPYEVVPEDEELP